MKTVVRKAPLAPVQSLRPALAGLVDVGSSSVGNLALNVAAAGTLGLRVFGQFSVGMLMGLLLVGLSRAVHSESVVLTHASAPERERAHAVSVSLGSTALASLGVAVVCLGSLVLGRTGDGTVTVLLSLGVVLPALVLQDGYRWAAHVSGRSSVAAVNNSLWTLTLGGMLALGGLAGVRASAPVLIALWGGTAMVGAVYSANALGIRPVFHGLPAWAASHRRVSTRLFLDWALLQATAEGTMLVVGVCGGAGSLALLRKAQLPLAPIVVLTSAMIVFLQPRLVRVFHEQGRLGVLRMSGSVAILVAALCAVYAGAVVALPSSVLAGLLGAGWAQARSLEPLIALHLIAGAVSGAVGIGLRATGVLGRQVRMRLLLAPVAVALVATGASRWGAAGASVALAASSSLIAATWCVMLFRHREHVECAAA